MPDAWWIDPVSDTTRRAVDTKVPAFNQNDIFGNDGLNMESITQTPDDEDVK
jgi:hypothetical protein